MKYKSLLLALALAFFLTSCYRASTTIEPHVTPPKHPKQIEREQRCNLSLPEDFSVNPFPPLTKEEQAQEWGKELTIGYAFAEEFDLYRAITSFKRAKCLLKEADTPRADEINYYIALAYYLGGKYQETLYTIESTPLCQVDPAFPPLADLLLILYDSYQHLGMHAEANYVLQLIEQQDEATLEKLCLQRAVVCANFEVLEAAAEKKKYLNTILTNYHCQAKSVRRAEMLNALLPGAGYWYIGQRRAASTALFVNALFIGAAAHFFANGNYAAGIITLSLESGWYFGGIYGAGLGAKAYNEHLYEGYALKISQKERFFPLMMLRYSF